MLLGVGVGAAKRTVAKVVYPVNPTIETSRTSVAPGPSTRPQLSCVHAHVRAYERAPGSDVWRHGGPGTGIGGIAWCASRWLAPGARHALARAHAVPTYRWIQNLSRWRGGWRGLASASACAPGLQARQHAASAPRPRPRHPPLPPPSTPRLHVYVGTPQPFCSPPQYLPSILVAFSGHHRRKASAALRGIYFIRG